MQGLTRTGRAAPYLALCLLAPCAAGAQSATNLTALRGLAPVATLHATPEGREALRSNLAVTGGIQTGALRPPTPLPFPGQQQQALRDAFITDGNAAQLADGLGTRLAAAYQGKAAYTAPNAFTSAVPSVADLLGYTNNVTKSDSNAGKFLFANATTNGTKPVSEAASGLLAEVGGVTDVFGRAYDLPAGAPDGDAFGNSRPFQTLPQWLAYRGTDYFGRATRNLDWLQGPAQDLRNSPSYPSGHTTYGTTESMVLAILVPERYQQMVVRAAEYGHSRILVGAHYAMDVIGGRTTSLHALAHLLANDPAYVDQSRRNPALADASGQAAGRVTIEDYPAAVRAARVDLQTFLAQACGDAVAACAGADEGRFRDGTANAAFIAATLSYGLPVVHPERVGVAVDVAKVAPEAGHLLTAAFPALSLDEANGILSETLAPGGGFLDDGSAFGLYSRLDLHAAGGRAAALAAERDRGRPQAR